MKHLREIDLNAQGVHKSQCPQFMSSQNVNICTMENDAALRPNGTRSMCNLESNEGYTEETAHKNKGLYPHDQ